jgi:hypothetical protein
VGLSPRRAKASDTCITRSLPVMRPLCLLLTPPGGLSSTPSPGKRREEQQRIVRSPSPRSMLTREVPFLQGSLFTSPSMRRPFACCVTMWCGQRSHDVGDPYTACSVFRHHHPGFLHFVTKQPTYLLEHRLSAKNQIVEAQQEADERLRRRYQQAPPPRAARFLLEGSKRRPRHERFVA